MLGRKRNDQLIVIDAFLDIFVNYGDRIVPCLRHCQHPLEIIPIGNHTNHISDFQRPLRFGRRWIVDKETGWAFLCETFGINHNIPPV